MRMSFSFSKRHELLLRKLAKKMDVSMVETLQRSLEALEEKEVNRVGIDHMVIGHVVRGEGNKLENITLVSDKVRP